MRAITTCAIVICLAQGAAAQGSDLDEFFAKLAQPDNDAWRITEADIFREWSKSGSAAMDLLLKRGEEALDIGDLDSAIGHLTALTDHAPEFATGWQMRGTAYAAAGYFGPALSDLARALALEPRQFVALTQLGAIMEEMENPEGALAAYRQSLKIHPHQQEAIDALARLEKAQTGTDI